jgi:hypothetical protein
MSGFTKLVPEIVQSSLWNEPAEIRCVWIAMIATKDASGYVRGDARTIARVANVPIESAKAALALFQEPDPSSHTPDNEGRRIIAAPGGWIILNHEIYRARDDVYREKTRQRVKRFRDKFDADNGNVTLQETLLKRNPSASVSASASVLEGDARGGELYSLAQIIEWASSPTVGMDNTMATAFFDHFNSVGWQKGISKHVMTKRSEIESAMRQWKIRDPSMRVDSAVRPENETFEQRGERLDREMRRKR